jgi:hypothetical protein
MVADLLLGAAPSPGIVLGGALFLDSLPSTRFDSGGISAKTGLSLVTVGPFLDGYPNPRGGLHAGGMLGASVVHLTGNSYLASNYGLGLATCESALSVEQLEYSLKTGKNILRQVGDSRVSLCCRSLYWIDSSNRCRAIVSLPKDDVAWDHDAGEQIAGECMVRKLWITRAENAVAPKGLIDLLCKDALHVNLRQYTEAFGGERVRQSSYGVVEFRIKVFG